MSVDSSLYFAWMDWMLIVRAEKFGPNDFSRSGIESIDKYGDSDTMFISSSMSETESRMVLRLFFEMPPKCLSVSSESILEVFEMCD